MAHPAIEVVIKFFRKLACMEAGNDGEHLPSRAPLFPLSFARGRGRRRGTIASFGDTLADDHRQAPPRDISPPTERQRRRMGGLPQNFTEADAYILRVLGQDNYNYN